MAREVSSQAGIPVVFLSALTKTLEAIDTSLLDLPVLALDRMLLKPWEENPAGPNNEKDRE